METRTLTDAEIAIVTERCQRLVALRESGKSAREIMMDEYMTRLPNKNEIEAAAMADYHIKRTTEFCDNLRAANEDPRDFVRAYLKSNILTDKTNDEKFVSLARLRAALILLEAKMVRQRLENDEEFEEMPLNWDDIKAPDTVTDKMLSDIADEIQEIAENSTLIYGNDEALRGFIEKLATDKGADAQIVVDFVQTAQDDIEWKAISSMVTYCAMRDGSIRSLPEEVGMDEVIIGTCSEVEKLKAIAHAGADDSPESMGILEHTLSIIGMVGTIMMGPAILTLGAALGSSLGGGLLISRLAGGMLGMATWMKLGEIVQNIAKPIAEGLKVTASILLTGAKMVGKLAVTAFDKAKQFIKRAYQTVKAKAKKIISKRVVVS